MDLKALALAAGMALSATGLGGQELERRWDRACQNGDDRACATLGLLYEEGAGVVRDAARAADLYARACEGGVISGCTNLGLLLATGSGVTRDESAALDLYRRACAQDEPLACDLLVTTDLTPVTTFRKVGRIVDAVTGRGLPEAVVVLPSLGIRTVSDASGRVDLGRLEAGSHRILAERYAYDRVQGLIDVPGNADFVILATPARIGDPLAPGTIVGRVYDETGRAGLPNVEIGTGDRPGLTLSNEQGRFRLEGVPAGLVEVRFVQLGLATRTVAVVVQPGGTVEVSAVMSTEPIALEPIDVEIRDAWLERSGYYSRERMGLGERFGPDDIAELRPMSVLDVLREAGRVQLRGGSAVAGLNRGRFGMCILPVYVDGVAMSLAGFQRLEDIPPSLLQAVEIYVGLDTPAEYRQRGEACGVILIWTPR